MNNIIYFKSNELAKAFFFDWLSFLNNLSHRLYKELSKSDLSQSTAFHILMAHLLNYFLSLIYINKD